MGMGITFIMTGLMSMAFMGFQGIKLANPTGNVKKIEVQVAEFVQNQERHVADLLQAEEHSEKS